MIIQYNFTFYFLNILGEGLYGIFPTLKYQLTCLSLFQYDCHLLMALVYLEQLSIIISTNFMESYILCKLCLFTLQMVHIVLLDAVPDREAETEVQGRDAQGIGCVKSLGMCAWRPH